MSNTPQSFRSAVLGFDRNDVVEYISAMAKERQDEVEAHRKAADLLRKELEQAKAESAQKDSRIGQLNQDMVKAAGANEELAAKRIMCAELSDRLAKTNAELNIVKGELERLQKNDEAMGEAETIIERARNRAADIEMMAYKRAETIEAEAARTAEKARAMLKSIVNDTKSRYVLAKGEAESVAYNVLMEITKLRDWFDSFPRLFDAVDERIENLEDTQRTQIRSFSPDSFDDSQDEE